MTATLLWAGASWENTKRAKQAMSGRSPIRKNMVKQTPEIDGVVIFRLTHLFEHSQNLVFAQNEVLLAVHLNLGAGVLAKQNAVAGLHFGGDPLAVVEEFAVSDGFHLGLLRLLL